jgi:hypothetical protein
MQTKEQIEASSWLFILLSCVAILVRNFVIFGEDCYAGMYHTTVYYFMPSFFRVYANAVSAKGQKSLMRNIFFNLVRNLHVQLIRNILYIGSVQWPELGSMALFTVFLTCVLQALPRKAFISTRYVWAFVWLEFAAVNGYTLIVHQNRLEDLYGHNLVVLFAFVYC